MKRGGFERRPLTFEEEGNEEWMPVGCDRNGCRDNADEAVTIYYWCGEHSDTFMYCRGDADGQIALHRDQGYECPWLHEESDAAYQARIIAGEMDDQREMERWWALEGSALVDEARGVVATAKGA